MLTHQDKVKRRLVADECPAGMYRMLVPIICKNEIEGFVSICGRPYVNADRIHTCYIHETLQEEEDKIKELLSSLDPIDYRRLKEIRRYITDYGRPFEDL